MIIPAVGIPLSRETGVADGMIRRRMFERKTTGSVVCPGCGNLVGVNDDECFACGRKNPGLWGFAPLLRELSQRLDLGDLILIPTVLVYLATLAIDPSSITFEGFGFLGPGAESLRRFGASGILPVVYDGRWWTVLSATWLHGGLLHIGFNMMWVRQLAPAMARLYGPGRSLIIYTAGGVVGFLLSSLHYFLPTVLNRVLGMGAFTVGASASLFGLFGAFIYYSRRFGAEQLGRTVWGWVLFIGVFGLVMPGVDNWAHLGGFLGGWGAAHLLRPDRPERLDHLVAGLLCLVAALAAIIASLLVPLQPWPIG